MNKYFIQGFSDELEKLGAVDVIFSPLVGAVHAGEKDRLRGAGYGFLGGNLGGSAGAIGGGLIGAGLGALVTRGRPGPSIGAGLGAALGGISGSYLGAKKGGKLAKKDGEAIRRERRKMIRDEIQHRKK